MSTTPCSHVLEARVVDTLHDVLTDHSAAEVARWVGVHRGTPTQKGADLDQWTWRQSLLLAKHHDGLRQAMIGCLMGADAPPVGEACAAVHDAIEALRLGGSFVAHIADALGDGRISTAEAQRLEEEILERRRREDEHLLPSLRACRVTR